MRIDEAMTFDPNSAYGIAVMEQVLLSESNDGRFERFCNALVSEIEGGAPVLSTSASWDLGRDGFATAKASGLYVCSSLRDDIDNKILSDIQRITSTTKNITRLYFCLSNKVSEHRKTQYEGQLSQEVDGKFPITCLGGNHLAQLAINSRETPTLFYGAEIADILRVLQSKPDDGAQLRGLRLALIASSAEDSDAIRRATYAASLLDVLKGAKPLTPSACAKGVSDSLRLHRSIAVESCTLHLDDLVEKGLVRRDGNLYQITDAGVADAEKRESEGVGRLLQLKHAIRKELESSLQYSILDDEFHRIWLTLEESLTHYFISRGEEIVSEIGSLVADNDSTRSTSSAPKSALSFLEDLADAIAAVVPTAERKLEVATAVNDIFSDRLGPAAEWLVKIAASFLSACAMGLEHQSAAAVSELLSKTSLVLDTDVLLSLVGEDEPEHEGAKALVDRWKGLTGRVYVGEPVLEEFARHAGIAQIEFDNVQHLLPGTAEDRLILFKNVFVRSFGRILSENKAKKYQWNSYLGQFRGSHWYDWANGLNTLVYDYGLQKLPPRSTNEAELENRVRKYLVSLAEQSNGNKPFAEDKARRDAQLYAAIIHHLKTIRALDPAANCVLISSARRLTIAEEQFKVAGDYQIVVSVSAMLYLVSLIPGVSLGMSAMKSFLFEGYRPGLSGEFERTLLRMVRASKDRELAFAQRGLLMKTIRDRFVKDAQEKGLRGSYEHLAHDSEVGALLPQNQPRTLEILTEALDKVGASHRIERENALLRQQNAELQRELARRRSKTK